MMPSQPVIIHGWSDHATSFVPLQTALSQQLAAPVPVISLAEWLSLDDRVTYEDLVSRMDATWTAYGLPRAPLSVDVVTHSTGALLLRHWVTKNFPAGQSPVNHLVMLAPANFGSPLAHKGRSFLGRVIKGWDAPNMFETGTGILKGLELASPYTWRLAQQDVFTPDPYYREDRTLATVLVGNAGLSGIASAANENGSDGTVRVSTANLNATYIELDLTNPGGPILNGPQAINGTVGFNILDGLNHRTIIDPNQTAIMPAILAGLQVTPGNFNAYCANLAAANQTLMKAREGQADRYYWGYQHTVFLLKDQFGHHVDDYFLEFYGPGADTFWESLFHGKVIEDVHPYCDDNGYRAVLLDITRLNRELAGAPAGTPLRFSLTASPDFANHEVGYDTFTNASPELEIPAEQIPLFFQQNRTLLLDVTITRKQKDEIFKLGTKPPPPVGA